MVTTSPTRTGVDGLVTPRLTATCPARQASLAMLLVLKTRTDHSHLSTRVVSPVTEISVASRQQAAVSRKSLVFREGLNYKRAGRFEPGERREQMSRAQDFYQRRAGGIVLPAGGTD